MISVNIIGFGKVGKHLAKGLSNSQKIRISQIYSRHKLSETEKDFLPQTTVYTQQLNQLKKSNISIICVSDSAIKTVSNQLSFENSLVVHTSGNTSMYEISNQNRRGVFYPVQTFSQGKTIEWEKVPFCLECEFQQDSYLLETLAQSLSGNYSFITENQRKKLHIAAVFANNFTNHLIYIAQQICKKNDIPSSFISPLIEETFQKIKLIDAFEAQSGPALRNDAYTLSQHQNNLQGIYKEIYLSITKSIQQTYGKPKL